MVLRTRRQLVVAVVNFFCSWFRRFRRNLECAVWNDTSVGDVVDEGLEDIVL